ncbi:histidine kinase [Roseateles sp.]|jgi:signal transduction histidine kinase|uniref:histidine kinase n=1 Tax=Roseateles sp. TaxID=1971397 RepID=UPI00391CAFC3
MSPTAPQKPSFYSRWQAFGSEAMRLFRLYANWLVSISWRRFIVLSVLLLIGTNILQELPPFTWRVTEHVEEIAPREQPAKPAQPAQPAKPAQPAEPIKPSTSGEGVHYEVTIDERGIRVIPRDKLRSASAASTAEVSDAASRPGTASSGPEAREPDPASIPAKPGAEGDERLQPRIDIRFPAGADTDQVREAITEAKQALEEAARDAAQAVRDAEQAKRDAEAALREAENEPRVRVRVVKLGDFLGDLAVVLILTSAIIKISYKGRIQAEVKAAQATETAEAESLKRQVVEARMAAMQAQVEPHFLFNTLASIDHLIEVDPPRASQMQKNLIALLRASMPSMREANANGGRDLGRELAVIRPYLEILKVRMEERLQTEIDVPEGLLSAEFPQMMIQSLVENAIKHGLEPKAEGGSLKVKAEIVHGKLAVTVADTGLGFGRAATAGTGVGLANIRERLSLLYGNKASVTIKENQPCGTAVTITVPYRSRDEEEPLV